MPEYRQFYKNCDCCSGSGSGSGSAACDCSFFASLCGSSPVHTNCKKNFVVNIALDFSGCVGTQMGSCGSGSGISGPETGLIVEDGSGSTGSDCRTTCKPCCELAAFSYELNLECFNQYLSTGFFNGDCIPPPGGYTCLGGRSNCPYFEINTGLSGIFSNLFDDGPVTFIFENAVVTSCNPMQINGTFNGQVSNYSSCLQLCIDGVFLPTCITGTFTITEALP